MKKLTLFGIVFLALVLIANPIIAKEIPASDNDAVGNFNIVIADSQSGDNLGFLIRGELKSLISEGMLARSIGKDLDAFIHSTTKSNLNGDEMWGRKIVKISNEENSIFVVLDDKMLYRAGTHVEEIELTVEKIERA